MNDLFPNADFKRTGGTNNVRKLCELFFRHPQSMFTQGTIATRSTAKQLLKNCNSSFQLSFLEGSLDAN